MKKLSRYLSLLAALILLLCQFSSCAKPAQTDDTTALTEEVTTAEPVKDIVIADAGECRYRVIRPEKAEKSSVPVVSAIKLKNALGEKLNGAQIEIGDDWTHPTMKPLADRDTEILIGNVSRVETEHALARIRELDFIITTENDRVVIAGGGDEATGRAVDYFIEHYVDPSNGRIALPGDIDLVVRYDYKLADPAINGVPISSFKIVYPAGAAKNDVMTYYCALSLCDTITSVTGYTLALSEDSAPESEYELLVGKTARSASASAAEKLGQAEGKFILGCDGGKVALLGAGYLSGSAAGALIYDCLRKTGDNVPAISDAVPSEPIKTDAKSAILLIGDGMGRNHIEASYKGGIIDKFAGDLLDWTWCTTYSHSVTLGKKSYTDSAAAGTALACGVKTVNGYIAKNPKGKDLISLRDLAHSTGAKTAILTTDKITGATPAVFLAHQYDRDEADDIQKQIDKLVAEGGVDFCEGSVDDKLLDRARAAMRLISANGQSFFTMIEEAYTDKGAHNNKWDVVYKAVKRINSVGYYLVAFTAVHPDTVLLITADHETGGITLGSDGKYDFTVTSHTNTDVPVYGLGPGVDAFLSAAKVDNTDISKFIAKLFTQNKWGE